MMSLLTGVVLFVVGVFAFLVLLAFVAMSFRVVVPTNAVHIVQSAKKTVSYGKDQDAGNTYYKWPAWIPMIGVRTINLPVSVFDVDLTNYAAYDKGRVPFAVDVMAFFRISDSNLAAQRVASFEELLAQLKGILQGACRSILASSELEEILEGRSKFGEMFTIAVDAQLEAWGVKDVKNIELMDIRDAEGSKSIANIMEKKKSLIERESRIAVAENRRAASEAEIMAKRDVDLREQEAQQTVGMRSAEKDKQIGITTQKAQQDIQEEAKNTSVKVMAVRQVEQVRMAEIQRDVQLVTADQQKQTSVIHAEAAKQSSVIQAEAARQTSVINAEGVKQTQILSAEGQKQQTTLTAQGNFEQAKLHAQGVELEGRAKGEAEKAVLLAPVQAQITLAEKIGSDKGYQEYLLRVREIEKDEVVGIAQADALKAAGIKVIANTGSVVDGVSNVMDLFTPKGATQLGAAVEAFAQTEAGAALLKRVGGGNGEDKTMQVPGPGARHP